MVLYLWIQNHHPGWPFSTVFVKILGKRHRFLAAGLSAANLNPTEWLQAWEPQVMLLGVGMGDRRARPAPEVGGDGEKIVEYDMQCFACVRLSNRLEEAYARNPTECSPKIGD